MVPSRDEIETKIESLAEEVAALRRRVIDLEMGRTDMPAQPHGLVAANVLPQLPEGEWAPAEVVGLVGRTLVVLGGAFLLRAISAAALLPAIAGPALGLLYAAWWLLQADRDAARGKPKASAFFHGLSGLGIAYPLLWETTARFHVLPGFVAAPTIVIFLILGLVVASRQSLRNLSWVALFGALATSLALLFATWGFVLYAGGVLLIAVAVESNASLDRWPELRWGPAVVLDVLLLFIAILVSQPRASQELLAALPTAGATAIAVLTPFVYLVSVAVSTLVRRRAISIFEIVQVGTSLLGGVGAALTVIAFREGNPTPVGLAISAIGLACYAVGFGSIDAEAHPRRNFYAYTSFAGVLVLVGTALLLDGSRLALIWSAFAWVAIVLGVALERNTLRLHGAIYVAAAAIVSGLVASAFRGLVGPAGSAGMDMPSSSLVIVVTSVALYAGLVGRREAGATHWTDAVPRALVGSVALWCVAAWAAPSLASLLQRMWPGLDADVWLASMRTAVLSTAAAGIVWSGWRWCLPELTWLTYPLLAFTGARMLWEDLAHGAPLNLFLAFGFYGGALILTSRLIRKEGGLTGRVAGVEGESVTSTRLA